MAAAAAADPGPELPVPAPHHLLVPRRLALRPPAERLAEYRVTLLAVRLAVAWRILPWAAIPHLARAALHRVHLRPWVALHTAG